MPKKELKIAKPGQAIPKDDVCKYIFPKQIPKQIIHFLSIKPSDQNGYEQSLKALPGHIVTMTTTSQHLIVVTE